MSDTTAIPPLQNCPTLSLVLPVLNEAECLKDLLPALHLYLQTHQITHEIIVVDDGGKDNLAQVISDFYAAHPEAHISLIKLSRNFGKEAALTAGLSASHGQAVICMDGDGQHPIELIMPMLEQWQQGYDMVIGVQTHRSHESLLIKKLKKIFYSHFHDISRIEIPAHAGDFRLMNRQVINALLALPERSRYMKGLYAWVGFKVITIDFEAHARIAGETKFKFINLVSLGLTGITSFSTKPLRWVSTIGIGISLCAIIYGTYLSIDTLLFGHPISGWTTLAAGMMFLSGIQLICLGVIAEYIGRIFEEAKQRPLYVIKETTSYNNQVATDL
jgi:glycosyltransferase involved in cell wall biosynthesis